MTIASGSASSNFLWWIRLCTVNSKHCMYVEKFDNDLLICIDNMLIVTLDKSKIKMPKKEFNKSFDMKDLGLARQILEMKIIHNQKTRCL